MILAIDPSIRHLGWATYNDNHIWDHGTIHIPDGMSLPATLRHISRHLDNNETPSVLIAEYPEFFSGSEKGATAAVQGTTFGLAAICGYLQGYYRLHPRHTHFYRPSEWKGQVPKAGMIYRFHERFGYEARNDHEAEAALMLDYYLKNQS